MTRPVPVSAGPSLLEDGLHEQSDARTRFVIQRPRCGREGAANVAVNQGNE